MNQKRDVTESPCFGCTHRSVGCHAEGKCRNPEETYSEWRARYDAYLANAEQKRGETKEHEEYLICQHIKAERRKRNRH